MLSAIVLLHSTAAGVQEATTGPFTFSPFLTTLDYLSLYMFILGTVQGLVRPSFHQIRQRTVSGVMPIIHPRSCAQRAKPLLPPTLRPFCWWATSFCASIVCHSCACIISTTPPAVPSSFFFFFNFKTPLPLCHQWGMFQTCSFTVYKWQKKLQKIICICIYTCLSYYE